MAEKTSRPDSVPPWYPADTDGNAATEITHARFDPSSDSLVVAIVDSVATITGDGITELPPLYETVDTEALAELMAAARSREQHVEVAFVYQDCRVTVSSGGDIVAVATDR